MPRHFGKFFVVISWGPVFPHSRFAVLQQGACEREGPLEWNRATMAAVYSEKGGELQENTNALSQDREGTSNVVQNTNNPDQVRKDAVGAVADSRHGGPSSPKNHAEIVGFNAVPPITIKEEPMEEEEEYMQINIDEIGDESEERASANESVGEENVDGE